MSVVMMTAHFFFFMPTKQPPFTVGGENMVILYSTKEWLSRGDKKKP
jgi:hypothetical protein